jgi:hypothetical protein
MNYGESESTTEDQFSSNDVVSLGLGWLTLPDDWDNKTLPQKRLRTEPQRNLVARARRRYAALHGSSNRYLERSDRLTE